MDDETHRDAEAVFSMDPVAVLVQTSRQLVQGLQTLADHARAAAALAPAEREHPQLRELLDQYERLQESWRDDVLPTIAASMKLALEVHDTFGPGPTRIDDEFEARLWNNKWFAALSEFQRSARSMSTGTGEGDHDPR